MFKKLRTYSIISAALLAIAVLFYITYGRDKQAAKISYDTSCVTYEQHTIRGLSMKETFEDGQTVETLNGYFDCNSPESGQIVVIEFPTRDESFVKRIVARSGDMLEFKEGFAKLNGEILKNPAGVNYQFSERSQKILSQSLYDGIIQDDYFLVLSDDASSSAFDSRQYGFLDDDHLKGLVINNK